MNHNISDLLPKQTKTVNAIFDWHKRRGDSEGKRSYLGASSIGNECERSLWYDFRRCSEPEFSGRLYRLFQTGHLEEPRMIEELRAIGCTVHDVDPVTGKQFSLSGIGGHFRGHMDGCALGIPEAPKTWHVLEFKTHNAKSFAALKKTGCVQDTKPAHYAQMMVYMGMSGMTRALYIAKNKDNDDLYSERINFSKPEFESIMARAERIIRQVQPPERMTVRPDDFRCRFCDSKELCWGLGDLALPLPSIDCRTCCHITPEIDEGEDWARWHCSKYKRDLGEGELCLACSDHLILPGLINFAHPIDGTSDSIMFQNNENEATWIHGIGCGAWSTQELWKMPLEAVLNTSVNAVKTVFGGEASR